MEYGTTLHGNPDMSDGVYFKIIKKRNGLFSVCHVQWFDEFDYDQSRFVRDDSDNIHVFETEEMAADKMNEWFDQEKIDPEYRRGTNTDIIQN